MDSHKLNIEQLDRKLLKFNKIKEVITPSTGWVHAIRSTIRMSLRQLGKKLNITAQSVREIETREKNGTVSINVLRQVGQALDMKFIYGFIPVNGTLTKMIEKKAEELAKEIVLRTSASMRLEDQENMPDRIKQSIEEKTQEILRELPRYLWD